MRLQSVGAIVTIQVPVHKEYAAYDKPPLRDRIDIHEWTTARLALDNAAEEDIDEMNDALFSNAAALERIKRVPELGTLIKRFFEHGVACGDAASCCNLANLYHDTSNNGSTEDYATAIELYELGKSRGDAQSAINLGYIYYYGRGVDRDYSRAYECYAFGAVIDDSPEGYWKLGDLYARGKGVRKSDYAAWIMYCKAYAHAGNSPIAARDAHHMADYLMCGIDDRLTPDPEAALRLYTEAEIG